MAITEVNDETRQRIDEFDKGARVSSSDLARQQLARADVGQRFIAPDQSFEGGLGGDISGPAFSDAINRKALQRYGQEMGSLRKRVNYQALNRKFDRLNQAAELVSMENAHNERVYQMRYRMAQERKARRGAVLGNVLGLVGTVVGGIYGGPGGAAAGGAVGRSLGEGMGGGG